MSDDFGRLAERLGYRFNDPERLRVALTHCSFGAANNERLEFLGDGAVNFVIASALFQRFPEAPEGTLSRLRASLVKGETLAEIAAGLKLGDYLRLGSGELKSGGFRRASILADAMEAVFGAVYLDGGFEAVRGLILALYEERLGRVNAERELKDPKTRLQEWLQGRRLELPRYEVIDVIGAAHDQTFHVRCLVNELPAPTEGKANSRRRAEQKAADKALAQLTAS
ncbi:ribonuclease III [Endothiovibrio diazotrophicus]